MFDFIKNNVRFILNAFCGALILYLIKKWFNGGTTDKRKKLTNKVILITGSSDGIGLTTAKQLLEDEAIVIFACRDEAKTLEKISKIKSEEMRSRAIFIKLDLSDFNSIKSFISKFKSNFSRLDILINNAGSIFKNFSLTRTGIESTLQVNSFGHMILTQELLDYLSTSKGRVINVSAKAHSFYKRDIKEGYYDQIDPETYDFEKQYYFSVKQYAFSKLGNIYFTQYLADYIKKNNLNIKTASLHPGVITSTEFAREYNSIWLKIMKLIFFPIIWLLTKSSLQGSQTTLHLCYLDDEEIVSGAYYSDCKLLSLSEHARDLESQLGFVNFSRMLINHYGKPHNIKFEL